YQSLGVEPPFFAHIPMVLGPDGARLSKRHGAKSILEYREEGYLPEALINYLARLGWGYGDQEFFTLEELIEKFDLKKINLAPARFDPEKLLSFNTYWLKTIDSSKILSYLKPFISQYPIEKFEEGYLLKIIESVKVRTKTLKEMAEMIDFYFLDELNYKEELLAKYITSDLKPILSEVLKDVDNLNFEQEKEMEDYFRKFAERVGIKLKDLAQAIRVALTGKTVSPPLFEVMKLLGKEKVKDRLKKVL
ncbi:MAG: glutamate--tRNA ligase, partial [Caldimicrobium sp.]